MSNYIYGMQAVKAALQNQDRVITQVFCTDNKYDAIKEMMGKRNIKINIVKKHAMDRECGNEDHQGVMLEIELKQYSLSLLEQEGTHSKVVMLDQLQDIRNIGAIIRTSAAFGFEYVIVSSSSNCPNVLRSDLYAQLAKAAAGALECIKLIVIGNIAQTMEKMKSYGYWFAGLDEAGQPMSDLKKFEKLCLVIGQEGEGLRRLTKDKCDLVCQIRTSDKFSCLNASVAAAIGMYAVSDN